MPLVSCDRISSARSTLHLAKNAPFRCWCLRDGGPPELKLLAKTETAVISTGAHKRSSVCEHGCAIPSPALKCFGQENDFAWSGGQFIRLAHVPLRRSTARHSHAPLTAPSQCTRACSSACAHHRCTSAFEETALLQRTDPGHINVQTA